MVVTLSGGSLKVAASSLARPLEDAKHKRSSHNFAKLFQSGAHLRLHRADRAAAQVGDLIVCEVAVLAEEENLLFFLAQVENGAAELVHRLLVLGLSRWH